MDRYEAYAKTPGEKKDEMLLSRCYEQRGGDIGYAGQGPPLLTFVLSIFLKELS